MKKLTGIIGAAILAVVLVVSSISVFAADNTTITGKRFAQRGNFQNLTEEQIAAMKSKRPQLTEEQKAAMEAKKAEMDLKRAEMEAKRKAQQEKIANLTEAQKAEFESINNEIKASQIKRIDKQLEYGLIDEATATQMKERINNSKENMFDCNGQGGPRHKGGRMMLPPSKEDTTKSE